MKRFFLLLLVAAGVLCRAQSGTFQCFTETAPPPGGAGTESGGPAPACIAADFMKFLPAPGEPMKIVPVKFVIVRAGDGRSPDNFDPLNAADVTFLNQMKAELENDAFVHNYPAVWPMAGVTDLGNTYIKIKVVDIVYKTDAFGWDFTNSFPPGGPADYAPVHLNDEPTEALNIFLLGEAINNGLGSYAASLARSCQNTVYTPPSLAYLPQDGGGAYICQKNTYAEYKTGAVDAIRAARELTHELGHCFGLYHTHPFAGTMDDFWDTPVDPACCAPPLFCDPAYGGTAPDFCDKCPASNNAMSYNIAGGPFCYPLFRDLIQTYFSPMQIAYMHGTLEMNQRVRQYVQIPGCTYNASSPVVVSTNEEWTDSRYLQSDVIVESGATLKISCTMVNFPSGASLIIKEGATLVVESAVLTSLCGGMWEGIQVWGSPSLPQAFGQGKVILNSEAVIENARTGVSTSRRDAAGDYVWGQTGGGIIQAAGAAFLNNRRDVEFMSYHSLTGTGLELDNVSYFENCIFRTTRYLKNPDYNISGHRIASPGHVTLWDVKGVKFTACTFDNTQPDLFSNIVGSTGAIGIRGTGIYSWDASYSLSKSSSPLELTYLSKGIEFNALGLAGVLSMRNAKMNSNTTSILVNGGGAHRLRSNTAQPETGFWKDPNEQFKAHLVMLNSNGFLADQNFAGYLAAKPLGTLPFTYGLISHQSGGLGGQFYKNTVSEGNFSYQTEQDNIYLRFQCNKNLGEDFGFVLNPMSVTKAPPAAMGCTGSGGAEAGNGNVWTLGCSVAGGDIYNATSTLMKYKEAPGLPGAPSVSCIYGPVTVLSTCSGVANTSNPCTPIPKPGLTDADLIKDIAVFDAEVQVREVRIDGGNTTGLLNRIQSDPQVFATLISSSPYLSDVVLASAFTQKPIPLTENEVVTLTKANAPVTPEIIGVLQNRIPALSQGAWQMINAAQTGSESPSAALESEVSAIRGELYAYTDELLYRYLEEQGDIGLAIQFLLTRPEVQYRYAVIPLLVRTGKYALADTELQQLPANGNWAGHQQLHRLMLTLAQTHRNVFQLTSAEKQIVRSIAESADPVRHLAKGLLELTGGEPWEFVPELLQVAPQKMNPDASTSDSEASTRLTVFPNPTEEVFTLRLESPVTGQVSVEIYSSDGSLRKTITWVEGETERKISDLSSGIWLVVLKENGRTTALKKVSVLR